MKHKVTELKLKNGARGLLIHVPSASVMTFELNFRAGEYLMERSKWEAPHLMEHLLLGANEHYGRARLFQSEFEKNGAYCNASTGSYDIIYEAECADFEWKRVIELLSVAINKPLFLGDEFWAEYGNVREELTARSNNHFRHLSLALRKNYGFHVATDQERLELMENIKLQDIKAHYKNTHTTSNMRFVIAGNLPPARREVLEKTLESFDLERGNGRIELPNEEPKSLTKPLYIKNDTIENLYFYFDTFAAKKLGDPELDALGLLNSMLTETLYSRILGTAREHGLVYSMSSNFSLTKNSTNWWFGAQVRPDNAGPLFRIVTSELKKVFNGKLSTKDITAAKRYALGKYQRGGQTVGGIAAGYAHRYFFDDTIDDYYQIPKRIKAITKPAIIESANAMFADKIWGFGTLGSAGKPLVSKLHKQLDPLWK